MSVYYAAIDFGTTFTGLAIGVKGSEKIYFHPKWPEAPEGVEVKAPTVALFNPNRSFRSFGFEAKKDFLDLDEVEQKTYYYFENFKMELHNREWFDMNELLDTSNNKKERKLPIINVFTAVIKYLKMELLQMLKMASPNASYNREDFQWIITVPAIWKSGARQLMREAAIKADLLEKNDPRKLIIALEPEAAAVHVKNDQLCDYKHYMIIDCGGGTVDICVHEIVPGIDGQDTIREKSIPSGGDWGGIYVDYNFVKFLEDLFSQKCINKIRTEKIQEWYSLLDEFQNAKKNFRFTTPIEIRKTEPELSTKLEGITINCEIVSSIQEFFGARDFRELLKKRSLEYGGQPVEFKHGKLQITKETMKSFFAPVITQILQHIKTQVENEKGCKGIPAFYLVGGFALCKLLQQSIIKMFEPQFKVVVPLAPQAAIICGAILYGMQPQIITERVATITYGIQITQKFDSIKHDKKYKIKNKEGIDHCDKLYRVLLQKNSIINPSNHEFPINLDLFDKDQTETVISLYTSDDPSITYVDQGAKLIGKVKHKIPNPEKGYSRHIKVVLDFSGTEIYLIVSDSESEIISYDTVDFLYSQY